MCSILHKDIAWVSTVRTEQHQKNCKPNHRRQPRKYTRLSSDRGGGVFAKNKQNNEEGHLAQHRQVLRETPGDIRMPGQSLKR